MTTPDDHECFREPQAVCPHCGHKHDDSCEFFGEYDRSAVDIECEECEKTFECEINMDITYTSSKKRHTPERGKE